MIRRLLALTALGMLLSGCYMLPMAFIGPATSGFTTASILQSGNSAHALPTEGSSLLKYFPEEGSCHLLSA